MAQIQANGIMSNKTRACVNLRVSYPDQIEPESHPLTPIFVLECQTSADGHWEELGRHNVCATGARARL
jgi:hypothetical protein